MARLSSDIDPAREVVPSAKPRRRRRKCPEPHKSDLEDKAALRARLDTRKPSPGVMLEGQGPDKGYLVTAPHSDLDLWEMQLAEAFGTRSGSVIRSFLDQLRQLVPEAWDEDNQRWKTDETDFNAALALVAEIEPRNSLEAALAAQMVAVHRMQIQLSAHAINRGYVPLEKEMAVAGKLARTFAQQMDTLRRLRGGTKTVEQSIHVTKETHQHVHYHRGEAENDGQPDATIEGRTGQSSQGSALPSQNQAGQVLRLPSRKG